MLVCNSTAAALAVFPWAWQQLQLTHNSCTPNIPVCTHDQRGHMHEGSARCAILCTKPTATTAQFVH